jgi:hypothetical protein
LTPWNYYRSLLQTDDDDDDDGEGRKGRRGSGG